MKQDFSHYFSYAQNSSYQPKLSSYFYDTTMPEPSSSAPTTTTSTLSASCNQEEGLLCCICWTSTYLAI